MAGGPLYTPEEDAKLRELMEQRAPMHEITRILGRPRTSVHARARNLGLRRWNTYRWTPEEEHQLQTLYLSNVPVKDIAVTLNRGVSAVCKRIFDLGIKRDARKTRLGIRYGIDALANGKDPAAILAEIREAEETKREADEAEQKAKIDALLTEMERGINAGCDRAFMFTAALVGGATLQAIGDRVGLTRERVRQVIEERANG